MKRRDFISGPANTALWPAIARAQEGGRLHRIHPRSDNTDRRTSYAAPRCHARAVVAVPTSAPCR
jgi:hypothetical protein